MPLVFPERVLVSSRYTAASLREILIDAASKRVIITVEYGDVVNGEFVRNTSIPVRRYTLDGSWWDSLSTALPNPTKGMYENVKILGWQALLAEGYEEGQVE